MASVGWVMGGGKPVLVPRNKPRPNKPGVATPATPYPFDLAPMDEDQFGSAVLAAQSDAALYIDGYVAPYRTAATRFYRGDPFGNEEDGRSQIVMTDVRDTTLAMLPGLLRIFTSSSDAVTFDPNTADKVEMAEQQTDYVNHLFYQDNPGFTILYDTFKDALIRKTGIIKYYWDETVDIYEMEFTKLTEGQMRVLESEGEIQILERRRYQDPDWEDPAPTSAGPAQPPAPTNVVDMQTGQPQPPVSPWLYDTRVRRYHPRKKVTIECVPCEEFICARTTRDLDKSPYLGHRSIKTISELVAMGYDYDEIVDIANIGDTFVLNYEAQTRNPAINAFLQTPDINDPTAKKVTYVEQWIRIDKDGDGYAELRKVCTIGSTVMHDEVVDEAPFGIFCPDPEPHMLIGNSVADQTMDLQLLKSNVMRGVLDSLAQSIHPRTAVVEGQVNLDDVLNVETGAIIRMRQPGMVQPFAEPFVGQNAMPVIEWIDNLRAVRTGIIPATAGLDPDVLQSTTASAVNAAIQGAQERTEMTARIFAEQLRRVMKGILKLVVRHQDKPRTLRLRGKWVEADPRMWDATLDCKVNVALGRGDDSRRIQSLIMIAQKQEQIIQLMGPMNPLADAAQYRNTLAKITELMGYKDVNQFWKPIDMAALQQQMASAPPKPDPGMVLAQAQMLKAQGEVENDKMKNMITAKEAELQHAREVEKTKINALVQMQSIEAQWGAQMSERDQQAETDRAHLLGDLLKHSTAEQNRLAAEAQRRDSDEKHRGHERELGEWDRAMSIHGADQDRQSQDQQHQRQLQFDLAKHRLSIDAQRQMNTEKTEAGERMARQKAAQRPKPK